MQTHGTGSLPFSRYQSLTFIAIELNINEEVKTVVTSLSWDLLNCIGFVNIKFLKSVIVFVLIMLINFLEGLVSKTLSNVKCK